MQNVNIMRYNSYPVGSYNFFKIYMLQFIFAVMQYVICTLYSTEFLKYQIYNCVFINNINNRTHYLEFADANYFF